LPREENEEAHRDLDLEAEELLTERARLSELVTRVLEFDQRTRQGDMPGNRRTELAPRARREAFARLGAA